MLKNPEQTKKEIILWIRNYFKENGPECTAVIGISGGKDSSVAAALMKEALGKERVLGILMPNGIQKDIEDSRSLVRTLDIPYIECNINEAFLGMQHMLESNDKLKEITHLDTLSDDARINLPPRLRMTTLYAVAQMLPHGGRIVNTCNRSEDYVGYSTKYGDAAGDFSPLSDLLVHEVLQLGEILRLPDYLVHKVPSDGLSNQSDEDKLGFTYQTLDHYILTGECEDEQTKKRIDHLHTINLHKLKLMPSFKLNR
ncbi:NAD(+) synthase [Eggerthia catenaformis]|uniref:NAD(+) synthase n=1 Tax=Eggerthia catenaformis TaxID=31973 RepID=UPI00047E9D11|nr:NAD(+) synthase [Eggerthia catenaformis]